MKNLAYLLFLAVVTFGTVGYFLNWYQFDNGTNSNGHRRLTLDIDADKIRQDVEKGETKLNEALENHGQTGQPATQAVNNTSNTQQKPFAVPQLQPPKQ